MTRRSRRLLGGVVLLALVGPALVDWLWTSDEERVVAALNGLEQGLEARDAAAAAAWFMPEVAVARPIPFLPLRGGLAEALRGPLRQVDELSLERDRTEIEFPEEDVARVKTSGSGLVRIQSAGGGLGGPGLSGVEGFRIPFGFTIEADFHRDGERFLLSDVALVKIEPGLH